MFKVECPGCKAPYQVDERRVPPAGLKMRCPKCGSSFQVEPPPSDPRGTSPTSPVLGAALGVGDLPSSPEGAPRPPLPRKKPPIKGTMIGVAPPKGAAPLPQPAPPTDADLPAIPRRQPDPFGEPTGPDFGDVAAEVAADPFDALDLPTAAAPGPQRRAQTQSLGTPGPVSLPAPRAPTGDADLPARAPAGRTLGNPRGGADLPAVPGPSAPRTLTRGSPAATDLPSRATGPSRPTEPNRPAIPRRQTPAPAPRAPDADLPTHVQVSDLPSPSFGSDFPAPAFGDDLPSLGFGAELPSLSDGLDLPSGMGGFGELDLPIVGGELPSNAAAPPSLAAGLPVSAAGLPVSAAGLPVPASDDPFAGAPPPSSFGSGPFAGAPSLPPFGAAPDPFGEPADPTNAFGGGTARMGSGEFGAPPAEHDPHEADFGGVSAPAASNIEEIVRKGGGGIGYGEVNLEAGTDSVVIEGDGAPRGIPSGAPGDAGAEFDGLPSESADAAPAVSVARTRAAGPGSAVLEIQQKRRRRRLRIGVAAVVATALAGGALTLVPTLGPFGAYFVVDQLRHGEYERILAAASDGAHREMAHDTYPDADRATKEVTAAAAQAHRFKPLAAYRAFVGFSRMLRFGGEPEIYASAKVALEELADARGVEKMDLARAARSAVDGEIAKARQLLDQLGQASPRDIDVAIIRGEVELKAKSGEVALGAWKTAAALEKSARTTYGLARAALAMGDIDSARKLANETLAANPKHVGARLILAETSWSTKRDESTATKLIEEILKSEADAGPEERIEAQTLFGEIHLDRGRVTQAEQAFGEAIRIAEAIKTNARAARALVGLGETLFRAGRYSQAIARFKTAAQADPDDAAAQVGVAKSSLELERPDDARDMLTKLRKSYPKDMQVAYWYGRVQESFGDRKEAEAAYRDSILSGKDDPNSVQAYIALAEVLSQNGQLDAANEALSEAQKKLPASPALHKALGRVAMTQGRYADARAAFEQALAFDADDIEAKFLVGSAMVRQREFDKALEIFDMVAKIDRDFPGLALERGMLFQESGRTEEALREYEAALAKAPSDLDLMLRVGCGKADAGNGDEAEKLLRKVLEQRPNSAETQFCMGRALMAKKNLNDAIKAFDHAIQIDPNRAEYYLYQGWASNEAGSIAKASLALKKALELDQGLADAYWQRGVLRFKETRAKDAVEDLQKALQLRPSRFEAHADLALAFYDLGKEDLALAEWQKAIAANPKEPTWRFHYGRLLSLRLENAAAAEQLKTALDLAGAQEGTFPWVSEAHRLAAMCLGSSSAAIPHWQEFLKTGALDSPYRNEAKLALKRLGAPWDDP